VSLSRISIIRGDITAQDVEAIVNAANRSLLGGGGVDGAIHRTAGPELLQECQLLGGCATGQSKITGGYALRAAYVIHTVGPVWQDGMYGEADSLASCYRTALDLAATHGVRTIAFPAISTGAYGYPMEQAMRVAFDAVLAFLSDHDVPAEVRFICHSQADEQVYRAEFSRRATKA
jgi:O-acetyl-ADP-ribose deacetylase